jgi:simple sugar transport system ATP-binding protein
MDDPATAGTDTGGAEPVLRLAGITKRFGNLVANDAIDLELRRGEVVALLGENGAGKTTLMNILFGHYVADAGEIHAFGEPLPPGRPQAALSAGIGMVHQHFTLADNLSVLDNILLGTEPMWRPWSARRAGARRIRELALDFGLEVDPRAEVGALSVGERQRVEILKALYRDARILILDEPTAVLTPQESESLFATLKRLVARGLSILFISHKLDEVLAASDRIVVLRAGRVAGRVDRVAADRHMLAEMMVGRTVEEPKRAPLAPGAIVLELRDISTGAAPARPALRDVSLAVRGREIVGVAGVSGNGQTTLADLLSGLVIPEAGNLLLDGKDVTGEGVRALVREGVGRVPEDRHAAGAVGDMSVAENAVLETYRDLPHCRWGLLDGPAIDVDARTLIRDFDVRCEGPGQPARLLSGGNLQKVILGRVLTRRPRFLLACQPTRGLDVGAVAEIHRRLLDARAEGAAILLISEDLDEILALSDRVAVIHAGRLTEPTAREAVDIRRIGLLMTGDGEAARAA